MRGRRWRRNCLEYDGESGGSFISNESPITGAVMLIQHRIIADSVPFALMFLLGADVRCLPFGLISWLRSDRQLNP